MSGLFPTGAFAGFGSHRLYPWNEAVAVHRVQARPKMSLRSWFASSARGIPASTA